MPLRIKTFEASNMQELEANVNGFLSSFVPDSTLEEAEITFCATYSSILEDNHLHGNIVKTGYAAIVKYKTKT